jgi:hypothetical protein
MKEAEADFATWVEGVLDLHHWTWYHVYDSRRDKPGFLDYVCVKGVWVRFIEIKGYEKSGRRGKLTPAQIDWKELLTPAECPVSTCESIHVESHAWWPEDRDKAWEVLSR